MTKQAPAREPTASNWEISVRGLRLALLFAACVFCVWILIDRVAFNGFSLWDDEGYFLLILKHFSMAGGLYVKTDSQFGPFFTLAESSLHRLLHVPVDLDGGRILTVIYILCSALLLSIFVGRLTRRLLVALSCFVLSVMITAPILAEPGHPQGIAAVLISGALCLSLLVSSKRENLGLILLGAIAAALVLTKINVGGFFCFALAFPMILMLANGKFRSLILGLFVVGSFCLPPVLMSAYLGGWAGPFCVYMLMSFAAVYIGAFQCGAPRVLRPVQTAYPILGFIVTAVPILAWAAMTGSTPASLVAGVLLRPLKYPRVFLGEYVIPTWVLFLLLLPVLVLAAMPLARRTFANFGVWLAGAKVAIAMIAAGCFLWNPDPALFYFLTLLPVLLVAPGNAPIQVNRIFPRLFLVSLIEFEMLQSYPVLDTHHNALTVSGAWVSLMLYDGWSELAALHPGRLRWSFAGSSTALGSLCFALVVPVLPWYIYTAPIQSGNVVLHHRQLLVQWLKGQPLPQRYPLLDLAGARLLRMPAPEVAVFRSLARQLHSNCDTLFTMPGMGSLNEWSETPTPNGYNLTCWMLRFTAQEQDMIRAKLEQAKRPCVVYNPELVKFWIRPGLHLDPNAPMVSYVLQKTKTVFVAGEYEIRVPYTRPTRFAN
jgi:hypothetical protein